MSHSKMTKAALYYLTILLFFNFSRSIFPEYIKAASAYPSVVQPDSSGKNPLLNGRVWHNKYSKARGDQFFLSNTFLKGSVTYNGKRFDNLDLQYDIANDELILKIESYPIIMMNKEMVDSFSLLFESRQYKIINTGNDTASILKGYVNVLYNGPSTLYVKYTKYIRPLALDGIFDLFQEEHRIYLRKDSEILPVTGKRKFFDLLGDKREEIRHFIKSYKLKIVHKNPVTYVPVIEYYDSIRSGER